MRHKVMIVDGMALLFRAYFASAYSGYIKRTSTGIPTNAVHGFVKYMMEAYHTFSPSHLVCCWDLGSRTFRTEKFENYKGNRPEAPVDLIPQFDLVKEVVDSFGIPNIGVEGYEADDCIGTLSSLFEADHEVRILTGDHDMLQLVSERVHVIIMKKGPGNYAVYDHETLLEEKGLTPRQIIDLKGLTGDTSDNYPGVKGIGEKTAVKLLQEHGTIDALLESLHLVPKGVKAKIEADLDMLHLSRELATIIRDVPLTCAFDDCRWSPDPERIRSKFDELEFGPSLLKMIG